jgi:hypothetical protein
VAEWTWDVFLPGEDLPRSLKSDYLLQEGEAFAVDGREWLADRVEIQDEEAAKGLVLAVLPQGPLAPTDDPS